MEGRTDGDGSSGARLPALAGGWRRSAVEVAGRRFELHMPGEPDGLLEDERVLERYEREDYMPYWAWLWPAAAPAAEAVLAHSWPRGTRLLEFGCGLGLVGLAAAAAGCSVTFSDHEPDAVAVALANARANGCVDVRGELLDWRTADLGSGEAYDVILGCDVIYEAAGHAPLLGAAGRLLRPGGMLWIADPGRSRAPAFCALAEAAGWSVEARDAASKPRRDPSGAPELVLGEFRMLEFTRPIPASPSSDG